MPGAESPAGWGSDSGTQRSLAPWSRVGRASERWPGGKEGVRTATPDEAVESLETIVLLTRFTASESCNDTPPPSQPATLLAMMLLVTLTEYQLTGQDWLHGKRGEDHFRAVDALEADAAAAAGFRRVAHDQVGIDHQAGTGAVAHRSQRRGSNPHPARPGHVGSVSGALMISIPPPLVGVVGLVLWLNRIELCSMSPF